MLNKCVAPDRSLASPKGMDLNDVEMAMVEIKPATKGKLYIGKSASSKYFEFGLQFGTF